MLRFQRTGISRWRAGAGMAIVAAALLLAACGGAEHGDQSQVLIGSTESSPTPTSVDAFIAYVESIVDNVCDTAEPVAIDTVPVTVPENTEPSPVR